MDPAVWKGGGGGSAGERELLGSGEYFDDPLNIH